MQTPARRLTMDELVALTAILPCASCGIDHARVRTCGEADFERQVQNAAILKRSKAQFNRQEYEGRWIPEDKPSQEKHGT